MFRGFKSLAQLGNLPKHGAESAKAWLYGKLFVALLVAKLIAHARPNSPWDTGWRRRPPPSARRDFRFMLHQVTRATEPSLALSRTLSNWNAVSGQLAGRPEPSAGSAVPWSDSALLAPQLNKRAVRAVRAMSLMLSKL